MQNQDRTKYILAFRVFLSCSTTGEALALIRLSGLSVFIVSRVHLNLSSK